MKLFLWVSFAGVPCVNGCWHLNGQGNLIGRDKQRFASELRNNMYVLYFFTMQVWQFAIVANENCSVPKTSVRSYPNYQDRPNIIMSRPNVLYTMASVRACSHTHDSDRTRPPTGNRRCADCSLRFNKSCKRSPRRTLSRQSYIARFSFFNPQAYLKRTPTSDSVMDQGRNDCRFKIADRIHTTFYNCFFALRILVNINGTRTVVVNMSEKNVLQLSCRHPTATMTFDSLTALVNTEVCQHGVSGVCQGWCENEAPIFQLVVKAGDNLAKLLDTSDDLHKKLAGKIEAELSQGLV